MSRENTRRAIFHLLPVYTLMLILLTIGISCLAIDCHYNNNDPCPFSPAAEELCEDTAEFIGLGLHNRWIPSDPACYCHTSQGIEVVFPAR